jgi:drug/metabolite transporter (DMT)-like permease
VAFVQMLKALTPVTTMLCAFAFQLERPTTPLIASITLITLGVMGASVGEVKFNLLGVLAMLSSVAAEGLRLVLMQHLVARKHMQSLEALLYLAPACSFWLLLYVGMFELPRIIEHKGMSVVLKAPGMFLVSGCIGFGVNGMAMAVISLASALTLKVLGICKDVGMVTLGVVLFGDKVSALQVWGYLVSLVGFAWYNHIKMAPKPPAGDAQHKS